MLDLTLIATVDGEEIRCEPTAGALIVLERKYGKPAAVLFQAPAMEHLAFLAWEQIRRNASRLCTKAPPPFEQWLDLLDTVETETPDGPKDS